MNDADIIKSLELCFTPKGTSYTCAKCPYHQYGKLCTVERDRDALDLINRQKAEIERLQKEKRLAVIIWAISRNWKESKR